MNYTPNRSHKWDALDYSRTLEHYDVSPTVKKSYAWAATYYILTPISFFTILPFLGNVLVLTSNIKRSAKLSILYSINIALGFLVAAPYIASRDITSTIFIVAYVLFIIFLATMAVEESILNHLKVKNGKNKPPSDPSVPALASAYRTYGAPEENKNGEDSIRTAGLLKNLLRIPGTRTFHNLRCLRLDDGDIDHVVISGNKIALIDSKLWEGVHHRFGPSGEIISHMADGRVAYHEPLKFQRAVQSMRSMYPGFIVYGWVAIHSPDGNPPEVLFTDNPYSVSLVMDNAQNVVDHVGNWFAEDITGIINVSLVQGLAAQLK